MSIGIHEVSHVRTGATTVLTGLVVHDVAEAVVREVRRIDLKLKKYHQQIYKYR